MSHRHYCDQAGHDWQCAGDCECCCGLMMEGHDYSGCPVELRACPEHEVEAARGIAEAMASESDPALVQRRHERPSCECGCAENAMSTIVGFCLHCTHLYVNYSPGIEDRHFADDCPGASEELKKFARESLVRH